jgi:hypothetical protein
MTRANRKQLRDRMAQPSSATPGEAAKAIVKAANATADELTAGLTFPKSKGTRPSKYTKKTVARLLQAISAGMPIRGACAVAGIAASTFDGWRDEHPELEEKIELAREQLREKLLERVEVASQEDWRAADSLLKLAYANDYRRAQQPSQTLHIHGDTHITLSPEKQAQLREQRRRILATTKGAHVLSGQAAPSAIDAEQEPAQTFRIKRQGLLVQDSQVLPEQATAQSLQEPEQQQEQPVDSLQEQQPKPDPAFANWHKAAAEDRRNEAQEVAEAFIRLR